jgi:hypothetical protein
MNTEDLEDCELSFKETEDDSSLQTTRTDEANKDLAIFDQTPVGTAAPNTSTSNLGAANARHSSLESVSVSTSNPEASLERTDTTRLNNTLPDEEDDMEGKISCGKF